jgi:hypothetical protein
MKSFEFKLKISKFGKWKMLIVFFKMEQNADFAKNLVRHKIDTLDLSKSEGETYCEIISKDLYGLGGFFLISSNLDSDDPHSVIWMAKNNKRMFRKLLNYLSTIRTINFVNTDMSLNIQLSKSNDADINVKSYDINFHNQVVKKIEESSSENYTKIDYNELFYYDGKIYGREGTYYKLKKTNKNKINSTQ